MREWTKIVVSLIIVHAVSVSVQAQDGVIQKMIDGVSADSLMTYDRALECGAGYYSRVAYTPGNDSSVQYILRTLLKNREVSTVGLDTFFVGTAIPPYNSQPLFNVFGIVKGKKEPTKAIVIGAHLDSYAARESTWASQWRTVRAPGADDNATGVATVLELGRIFGNGLSFGFSPDYTIILVAFNAEESGKAYPAYLYGSAHFAAGLKEQGYTIVAMINIDMTGYNTAMTVDVVTDDRSRFVGDRSVVMNTQYGLGLAMNASPFVYATYSDHSSFWNVGYPAILFIEHASPSQGSANYKVNTLYHSSSDTSGALNPELVRRSAQLALATAASFAVQQSGTDIHTKASLAPTTSGLGQNYPNPFNPATKLPFSIATTQHVQIVVYDALGRERARLIDETMQPGTYTAEWNAVQYPSGMYIAVLRTGTSNDDMEKINIRTAKLLLQK